MRIRVLSDLHFEFMRDQGQAFVDGQDVEGIDVVILAGDICLADKIPQVMGMFCKRVPHVVALSGNHEHYGSTRENVLKQAELAMKQNPNLHYLDKELVEIDGVRFLGATMWFAKHPTAPKGGMTDFRVIHGGFTKWVYQESDAAVEFFRRELREGDIAVTHHLPSYKSVAPQYRGHPLNPFFVREVDDIILEKKPAYWVHGHTHTSTSYTLGNTRVLCNPFGYLRVEENASFDWGLTIDVPGVVSSG